MSFTTLRPWLACAVAAIFLALHILVDLRLCHGGCPPGLTIAPFAAALICAIVAIAIMTTRWSTHLQAYWVLTVVSSLYLLACHASGVIIALSNPSYRMFTPLHTFRCLVMVVTVCYYAGLRPLKAWTLVTVGVLPLLFIQPMLLAVPSTWESRNRDAFIGLFLIEAPLSVGMTVIALVGSFTASAALLAAQRLSNVLERQAAQTQALLQAAMPPAIARALLDDVSPSELTRGYPSATIAFIALEEYRNKVMGSPIDLLQWLDSVYQAFDALVDAYKERVNKIEIVANTYVISTGLPVDDPGHCLVMCAFCIDLLELCDNVPGVGPVRIRIGIHTGAVVAGVIGHSRRFFRVFGDTVNVASRMMSSGMENRVHISHAVAKELLSSSDAANPNPKLLASHPPGHVSPPVLVLLPPSILAIEYRGLIPIKGKVDMHTYWLTHARAAVQCPSDVCNIDLTRQGVANVKCDDAVPSLDITGDNDAALESMAAVSSQTTSALCDASPGPSLHIRVPVPRASQLQFMRPGSTVSPVVFLPGTASGDTSTKLVQADLHSTPSPLRLWSPTSDALVNFTHRMLPQGSRDAEQLARRYVHKATSDVVVLPEIEIIPIKIASTALSLSLDVDQIGSAANVRSAAVILSAVVDMDSPLSGISNHSSASEMPEACIRSRVCAQKGGIGFKSITDPLDAIAARVTMLDPALERSNFGDRNVQTAPELLSLPHSSESFRQGVMLQTPMKTLTRPNGHSVNDSGAQTTMHDVSAESRASVDQGAYVVDQAKRSSISVSSIPGYPTLEPPSIAPMSITDRIAATSAVAPILIHPLQSSGDRGLGFNSRGDLSETRSIDSRASHLTVSTVPSLAHNMEINPAEAPRAAESHCLPCSAEALSLAMPQPDSKKSWHEPYSGFLLRLVRRMEPTFTNSVAENEVQVILSRQLFMSVLLILSIQGAVGLAISASHIAGAGRSNVTTSGPIATLAVVPVLMALAWTEYAACAVLATMQLPCLDTYCEYISSGETEQLLLWRTLLLGLLGMSTLILRLSLRFSVFRLLAFVIIDVLMLVFWSLQLRASADVCVLAAASLLFCHVSAAGASRLAERILRDDYALQRALRSAASDARALLMDLFPPAALQSLLSGESVHPIVSECAVVLYCDLANFTRLSSTLSASDIMKAMHSVFTAFDNLVQDSNTGDGARDFWKVDTAGDAYIVVAGAGTGDGSRRVTVQATFAEQQLSVVRTRALLDRMFLLGHSMQAAMSYLRQELHLPLHARIGIHCGTVVAGIVGSQRPRFCVLGPALIEAEHAEEDGAVDGISCTGAAQRVYLSSTFMFLERATGTNGARTINCARDGHLASGSGGLFDVKPPHPVA